MNTIKIPQNGFPQVLTNIPFGQILILINPSVGILSKNVLLMQFIYSMARDYGHQSYIINSLPVDCPELWDCAICKIKSKEGIQILISDMDSIVEMLCEFWGLDYDEVSKGYVVADRYKKYVFLGGESHPVRIPVAPVRKPEKEVTEGSSTLLQCITVHTKETELAKIEEALDEAFIYHIDISGIDLLTLLDKVIKKERKTYELDIDIIPGEEDWDIEGKELVVKRAIDIIITDDAGIKHHITDVRGQTAALYLTFILFSKEGIKIADLKTNDEFYNLFIYFCKRLKSTNKLPNKVTLWKNANRKRGEIKSAIKEVTNGDLEAMMLFGIEGEEEKENKVAGATDELREKIRKEFDIE